MSRIGNTGAALFVFFFLRGYSDFGKMSAGDILYFPIAENRVFRSKGRAVPKYAIFGFVILLIVWRITPFLNFFSLKNGSFTKGKTMAFGREIGTLFLPHGCGSQAVPMR